MDATFRRDYRVALKQAEAELANHEKRGEALRGAIAALQVLVAVEKKPAAPKSKPAPAKRPKRRRKSRGAGHPDVPSNAFKGMGPTFAYRKFLSIYGTGYTVPQIRDALIQGGVKSTSSTSLLTGLHSVRRRDRLKEEAQQRLMRADAAKSGDAGDA